MAEILTYRDTLLNTVPRWLKGYYGSRLLYSMSVVLDALGTSLYYGALSKFPGYGDEYALGLVGGARGITRGPGEGDDQYATRLTNWRLSRKRKGNAFALMEQIEAYFEPYDVRVRVIADNGDFYELAPHGYRYASAGYVNAPAGVAMTGSGSWNWDGSSDFSRYWVVLQGLPYVRDGYWGGAGYWGGLDTTTGLITGTGLDPLSKDVRPTYGSTASYSTVQGLLSLIRDWTPPNASFQSAIVSFDSNMPSPDGTWGSPGNRNPSFLFWN